MERSLRSTSDSQQAVSKSVDITQTRTVKQGRLCQSQDAGDGVAAAVPPGLQGHSWPCLQPHSPWLAGPPDMYFPPGPPSAAGQPLPLQPPYSAQQTQVDPVAMVNGPCGQHCRGSVRVCRNGEMRGNASDTDLGQGGSLRACCSGSLLCLLQLCCQGGGLGFCRCLSILQLLLQSAALLIQAFCRSLPKHTHRLTGDAFNSLAAGHIQSLNVGSACVSYAEMRRLQQRQQPQKRLAYLTQAETPLWCNRLPSMSVQYSGSNAKDSFYALFTMVCQGTDLGRVSATIQWATGCGAHQTEWHLSKSRMNKSYRLLRGNQSCLQLRQLL